MENGCSCSGEIESVVMTSSLYNERDQLRQTRIKDRYWVTDQGNDKEVLKLLLRIELEEKRMGIECKNLFCVSIFSVQAAR